MKFVAKSLPLVKMSGYAIPESIEERVVLHYIYICICTASSFKLSVLGGNVELEYLVCFLEQSEAIV